MAEDDREGPGGAEGPAAHDVGQPVLAQVDPAQPDREREEQAAEHCKHAPGAAAHGDEDEVDRQHAQHRRVECVPAGPGGGDLERRKGFGGRWPDPPNDVLAQDREGQRARQRRGHQHRCRQVPAPPGEQPSHQHSQRRQADPACIRESLGDHGEPAGADVHREICRRHGIIVISDEIHQDLVLNPDVHHIPWASLGEEFARTSITCTAPSKTFNLAGLQSANIFIPDRRLREEYVRQYDRSMFPLVNVLGMVAAEAAYTHGEPWLEELLDYLRGNHAHFAEAGNSAVPDLEVLPADSLYLAWMDCRRLGMEPLELQDFMLREARLWLDQGQKFGVEGHGYMRVNLGCPRSTVDEAVSRLTSAVQRAW